MPLINNCFISKKDIEGDKEFLKSQGLSEEQISAIAIYFQQRITGQANSLGMWMVAFLIAGAIAGYYF